MSKKSYTPTVLTIAGFDPYGGAGIQIDTKTIHALGAYAFSVTTSLTAQNESGVKSTQMVDANFLKKQLDTLLENIEVDAVKIGMLGNSSLLKVVIDVIDRYELKNIVLDTVLISSSGKELLEEEAWELMVEELFPRVSLITPNIPEVNALLGISYSGEEYESEDVANILFQKGVKSLLLKGGHSTNRSKAVDYYFDCSGHKIRLQSGRVETSHTHGTGCLLSSAIATGLAKGDGMEGSLRSAKEFLYEKLRLAESIKFKYKKESIKKEPIL